MNLQTNCTHRSHGPLMRSAYDDFGVKAEQFSNGIRLENAERAIQRFFVGKASIADLEYEAILRSINPDKDYKQKLEEAVLLAEGGFGPQLTAPSVIVENAFRDYAQTDLGAVAVARLLDWDDIYIDRGWRDPEGGLTDAGITAYGEGKWRPFRVASSGYEPDTVTQSGVMVVPDILLRDYYSTGDIEDPFAILHHELKAHVLPLKEAAGLVPGLKMELICVRLESEMLLELGLPQRRLNWGKDDGSLNHTLHESSEHYFRGLVRYDDRQLVEIDPETGRVIGHACIMQG